jgi:hypothetical protein
VARGAVIAVLQSAFDPIAAGSVVATYMSSMPSVVSRVARLSYGVAFGIPPSQAYPPPTDDDEYYMDPDGTQRVRRMTWYLKKVRSANGNLGSLGTATLTKTWHRTRLRAIAIQSPTASINTY